jgi:broad specificity phosphatase PhoE
MKLLLVRHGETLWNKERRLQGHQDSPLTEDGKKQIAFLAEALKNEKIDAAYCSDLGRAIDSSKVILASHNLKAIQKRELRERSHGIVQGMTQKQADKEYPELQAQRKKSKFNFRNPKGESYADAEQRIKPFIQELLQKHLAQTVLLITHAGINRIVLGQFCKLSSEEMMNLDQPHECIYVLENAEANHVVSYVNGQQKGTGFLKRTI